MSSAIITGLDQDILSALAEGGVNTVRNITRQCLPDTTRASVSSRLQRLRRLGLVRRSEGRGHYWHITDLGRKAIA